MLHFYKTYYILIISLCLFCNTSFGQADKEGKLYTAPAINHPAIDLSIRDILILGNDKTKSSIILRELPIRPGEVYNSLELVKKMEDGRKQLLNTTLFHTVSVIAIETTDPSVVDVLVTVKERWYIFPVPYFKPADRNLNQWLFEKHANLDRVNYGAKVVYNNATGRNDKFRAVIISGYTRQVGINYNRLYIDRKMRWGLNAGFSYGKAHEMNYNTIGDKQVFLKDQNFIRSFTNANFAMSYRRAIRARHNFGISYTTEQVADTIVKLNPEYFKPGRNRIDFPTFYYTLDYFNLDYIPYPTQGYALRFSISKSGINNEINLWQLHAKASAYFPISSRAFIQGNVYGGIKVPFKQPWFSQRFLGYGDVFMQGYEYYVVDGVAGGYCKASFVHELFHGNVHSPHIKRKTVGEKIPFQFYGKVYGNLGYVYNPEPGDNALSNKLLFSGGIGLDIVTIYDLSVRLEWSFNQLGQNGLFLHPKTIF